MQEKDGDNVTQINKEIFDRNCRDVPINLRKDPNSPLKNDVPNIILNCMYGIIKGILSNLYDKAKTFFDLFKSVIKIFGFFPKKAYDLAKALWASGSTLLDGEIALDGGNSFFQTLKEKFTEVVNFIDRTFRTGALKLKKQANEFINCYSPVARSRFTCQFISYLGTEFFLGGFVFKAVSAGSKIAKSKELIGLASFLDQVSKAKTALDILPARAIRRFLFKVDGINQITVKATKLYRRVKNVHRRFKKYDNLVSDQFKKRYIIKKQIELLMNI